MEMWQIVLLTIAIFIFVLSALFIFGLLGNQNLLNPLKTLLSGLLGAK